MKVEYSSFYLPGGEKDTMKALNELGQDGWRVCSPIRESSVLGEHLIPQYEALFYREIPPNVCPKYTGGGHHCHWLHGDDKHIVGGRCGSTPCTSYA